MDGWLLGRIESMFSLCDWEYFEKLFLHSDTQLQDNVDLFLVSLTNAWIYENVYIQHHRHHLNIITLETPNMGFEPGTWMPSEWYK